MNNIYNNLIKLNELDNSLYIYQIDFLESFQSIDINLKENKNNSFKYQIQYDNEDIRIIEFENDFDIDYIEIFRLNHIQFEDDRKDIYISKIIYSFFKNLYQYLYLN